MVPATSINRPLFQVRIDSRDFIDAFSSRSDCAQELSARWTFAANGLAEIGRGNAKMPRHFLRIAVMFRETGEKGGELIFGELHQVI
jgi:hypothetical protein